MRMKGWVPMKRRFVIGGIGAGVAATALFHGAMAFPDRVEALYTTGLYPLVVGAFARISGLFPFFARGAADGRRRAVRPVPLLSPDGAGAPFREPSRQGTRSRQAGSRSVAPPGPTWRWSRRRERGPCMRPSC